MLWKKFFFWSASVAVGIALYGFLIGTNRPEVRHIHMAVPGLATSLKGKVVVHLSDLHITKIGSREERVLAILDELTPDIIFLTGDYVKWKGDYEAALDFLARLRAHDGIWAVMGDYDYSNSRKSCLFCHEKGTARLTKRHHVKFLRNSLDKIVLNGESLWIAGLDMQTEPSFFSKKRYKVWEGHQPLIVLSHNPFGMELFSQESNVLVLAGDTHGGQVPLPRWFWHFIGYEKNAKYPYGIYTNGKVEMFVSKGVGTSKLPIRLLRRPEIAVLHFSE